MKTPAETRAQYKYLREKTHRVAIDYPNAEYNKIKAYADRAGIPVNTFIREAIRYYIREIDEANGDAGNP